jgi:hypothetical protein
MADRKCYIQDASMFTDNKNSVIWSALGEEFTPLFSLPLLCCGGRSSMCVVDYNAIRPVGVVDGAGQ